MFQVDNKIEYFFQQVAKWPSTAAKIVRKTTGFCTKFFTKKSTTLQRQFASIRQNHFVQLKLIYFLEKKYNFLKSYFDLGMKLAIISHHWVFTVPWMKSTTIIYWNILRISLIGSLLASTF